MPLWQRVQDRNEPAKIRRLAARPDAPVQLKEDLRQRKSFAEIAQKLKAGSYSVLLTEEHSTATKSRTGLKERLLRDRARGWGQPLAIGVARCTDCSAMHACAQDVYHRYKMADDLDNFRTVYLPWLAKEGRLRKHPTMPGAWLAYEDWGRLAGWGGGRGVCALQAFHRWLSRWR
jgi:hypothetical protein